MHIFLHFHILVPTAQKVWLLSLWVFAQVHAYRIRFFIIWSSLRLVFWYLIWYLTVLILDLVIDWVLHLYLIFNHISIGWTRHFQKTFSLITHFLHMGGQIHSMNAKFLSLNSMHTNALRKKNNTVFNNLE